MEFHHLNPHRRAIITLAGLTGFAFLVNLVLVVSDKQNLGWISFIFLVSFILLDITIWLLGFIQMQRAKAFLNSDRPLIRWVYSTTEWQQLKENTWQAGNEDWKLQWGCLTFLLALAGSLTGGMLGLEEGIQQVGLNTILGFVLGALLGGLIGALVAGGNHLGAVLAYRNPYPGQVALGLNEIYVNGDYFKGDGNHRFIQDVKIYLWTPAILEFQLVFPPRPRMPREEEWNIPVPDPWIEKVTEILPFIIPQFEKQPKKSI